MAMSACASVSTKRVTFCVCVCVCEHKTCDTLSMCESVSTSATMFVSTCEYRTEGKITGRCTFRIHGKQNPPKTHRLFPGTHPVQTAGKLQMANRKLAFRHNGEQRRQNYKLSTHNSLDIRL